MNMSNFFGHTVQNRSWEGLQNRSRIFQVFNTNIVILTQSINGRENRFCPSKVVDSLEVVADSHLNTQPIRSEVEAVTSCENRTIWTWQCDAKNYKKKFMYFEK